MKLARWAGALALAISSSLAVSAADLAGSRDPDGFKRFEGSSIVHYQKSSYASYELARDEVNILQSYDFAKSETVEGELVRIIYLVPEGHSALEVFRNYQDMLSGMGFSKTFELARGSLADQKYFFGQFYFQSERDERYAHEVTPFEDSRHPYYMTAKGVLNGRPVSVALLVAESTGLSWSADGISGKTVTIAPAQVVVALDVVTGKPIIDKMVTVKAQDMAKSLASSGTVDLYGIYFDTDKSDIKPESKATLDQIAQLLKSDPKLRLEIGGHTDNTGRPDHNRSLSTARAQTVMHTLVAKYGIDAKRLQANGYGDTHPIASNTSEAGRAKNRRVALRKL